MIQQTSVNNSVINQHNGVDEKTQEVVLGIFKAKMGGTLTNKEMQRDFHEFVANFPATTPDEKAVIHGLAQGLNSARTALTHKGRIPKCGMKICSVSGRNVNAYTYGIVELTKLQQLENEVARRKQDLIDTQKKIIELDVRIAKLKAKQAQP